MNCSYHINKNAVSNCKICNKPICEECNNIFKNDLCIECAKNKAINKLAKGFMVLLISILLIIVSINILKKVDSTDYSNIFSAIINGTQSTAQNFLEWIKETLQQRNIVMSKSTEKNISVFLNVYWLASLPWGYYILSKIFRISGILVILLKLGFSTIVGPIVMPIALIIFIVSIIKNWNIIYRCTKTEKSINEIA